MNAFIERDPSNQDDLEQIEHQNSANAKIDYICGDPCCRKRIQLTRKEMISCSHCGSKILFKVRRKDQISFYNGR